jgi:hypothetical protein
LKLSRIKSRIGSRVFNDCTHFKFIHIIFCRLSWVSGFPPVARKMFGEYLKNKLKACKIDVGIYHSYLIGILEDNIAEDEKKEMLNDIISSLIVSLRAFMWVLG